MFAKNKVSQSMIDAVNSVISEGKVEEASEKVPTPTGMKVYGSSYGNSKKARADQTKSAVDNLKGPKDKEMKQEELKGNQHKIDKNKNNKIDAHDFKILRGQKSVTEDSCEDEGHEDAKQDKAMIKKMMKKEEGDCVTKPEVKTIAKKEVGSHEKKMHKSHVKENIFYNFAKQLQEDKSKGTEPTFTDNNVGEMATPKKNQDIADKAYLKHKPGTVKGQLTQVSRFLRGKPEIKEDAEQIEEKEGHGGSDPLANREKYAKQHGTGQVYKKTRPGDKVGMTMAHAYDIKRTGPKGKLPEEIGVDESVQTQPSKSADKITTDTLAGRMPGGKLNSFKNYKTDLTTSGVEAVPKEFDNGVDTKEKQKITTSPGPIDIKMDDKLAKKSTQKEEVEAVEEKVIAGMSGFKKIKGADEKGNVTDKSGAVHTPMSRAKNAAKLTFSKLKQEMLGKISN